MVDLISSFPLLHLMYGPLPCNIEPSPLGGARPAPVGERGGVPGGALNAGTTTYAYSVPLCVYGTQKDEL